MILRRLGLRLAWVPLLLLAPVASGQIVLIDQIPEVAAFGFSGLSDTNCTFGEPNRAAARAEDFLVTAPVDVHTIEFQGLYLQSTTPSNPETFLIRIHSDSAGLPGAVVAAPAATITQVSVLQTSGISLHQFTASFAPVHLVPGVYWAEIVENDSSTTLCFNWQAGFRDVAHSAPGSAIDFSSAPGVDWQLQVGSEEQSEMTLQVTGASPAGVPAGNAWTLAVLAALLLATTRLALRRAA